MNTKAPQFIKSLQDEGGRGKRGGEGGALYEQKLVGLGECEASWAQFLNPRVMWDQRTENET